MMNTQILTTLIADLADDFREPQFLWQVGTVAICFLMAWQLSRVLRRLFTRGEPTHGVMHIGVESFSRVLSPALNMVFLGVGEAILGRWQHTHLLTLLFPIIGSLAIIRFGFYIVRKTFSRQGRIVTFLPVGKNKISLLNILQASISVVLTIVIALWASAALGARLMFLPSRHSSLKVVLSRVGRALLILIAILVSLTIVGIDLTVLSVFGGALGVGLGFGLQKIASSYVSGFIILLDRSMSIGDMITVDKFNGRVTQINTRYTVLQGFDGAESVIPNEMLVSSPVQNFSLTNRTVAMTTDLVVSYQTDIEKIMPLLVDAVAKVDRIAQDPAPAAYLMKFGSDGLELRVGFWIIDPENGRTSVLSHVNRALWQLIQEQEINLPYPQRVVTLSSPLGNIAPPAR